MIRQIQGYTITIGQSIDIYASGNLRIGVERKSGEQIMAYEKWCSHCIRWLVKEKK